MKDSRELELAKKLVKYSCRVQKDENVLIIYSDCSEYFINCIIKEVINVGGNPYLKPNIRENTKNIIKFGSSELFRNMAKHDCALMKEMDAVILVGGQKNDFEFSDVPAEKKREYDMLYNKPVHMDIRVKKKWVLLRYPTHSFAQSAKMATEEFEDFYFSVCNLDYNKMCGAMINLSKLMSKTDKVHIIAKNTDLTFSIKNISNVKCCGECNIPDGELYTAPVKHSINGVIEFNIPTIQNGKKFQYIRLTFENGKVVKSESDNNDELIKILNTDEGSRYVGEFAFGLNPHITKPINDILFDEKMSKSIHMALGSCYDDANNYNISAIHWDLIQSHTKEMGGGKIYFDDKLIYENGDFLLDELVALNAENLL